MDLIVSLLLGAAGGNIGGTLIKKISLGNIGNSLSGLIGGGMGAQIFQSAMSTATNTILANIIGGVAGGILVMALLGIIKHSWSEAKS